MNEIFEQTDKAKLSKMLEIKKAFSDGLLSVEQARQRMANEVGRITPEEFAAAEQLIKEHDPEECRKEDVRTMLDIFDGLIPETKDNLPFGHSIDAYLRENEELEKWLVKGDQMLKSEYVQKQWLEIMEAIMPYKVHFSRKQNQLYSILERKGFDRPTTTMWPYDDEIREEMNRAMSALEQNDIESFLHQYQEMSVDLRDLMSKEQLILYPTSLKLISDSEFEEMKYGDREIGFYAIEMPPLAPQSTQPPKVADQDGILKDLSQLLEKHGFGRPQGDVLHVAEGNLTLEQINLIFKHLPVDISYVDENELVKFYSDTPHRVFPRSKGIIGREVRNCHPPKSVHLVEEIIEKFRKGEQDSTDFWINKPDLFIYIKYVAVRDEQGQFRGVLEMMQDCTRIRQVSDSRTLLTWEEESTTNKESDSKSSIDNVSEINPNTKLKDLLKQYPKLISDLPKIDSKFKMLSTPMSKIILPKATIQMMSERADIDIEHLIHELKKLIASY